MLFGLLEYLQDSHNAQIELTTTIIIAILYQVLCICQTLYLTFLMGSLSSLFPHPNEAGKLLFPGSGASSGYQILPS